MDEESKSAGRTKYVHGTESCQSGDRGLAVSLLGLQPKALDGEAVAAAGPARTADTESLYWYLRQTQQEAVFVQYLWRPLTSAQASRASSLVATDLWQDKREALKAVS